MSSDQVLEKIRKEIIDSGRDARYKTGAYLFVLNGLEFYLTKIGEQRHVTGQEFSRGLAEFAVKQFGPLALKVLTGWGIRATADLGNIVYNLIGIGLMTCREKDKPEDFADVFNLAEFFKQQDYYPIDKEHIRRIRGA
jgi:uncharacterized repeat protein (TIGR04138 family)